MKTPQYEKLIEKSKIFIGKLDGDDIHIINHTIDFLVSDEDNDKYCELYFELADITNIMYCEFGLDYGEVQYDWDDTAWKILDNFKDGYSRTEENLNILIDLILKGIK